MWYNTISFLKIILLTLLPLVYLPWIQDPLNTKSRDWHSQRKFYSFAFHIQVGVCRDLFGVLSPHWNERNINTTECFSMCFKTVYYTGSDFFCTYLKPWTNRSKKNTINKWWVYQNISYEARLQANNTTNSEEMMYRSWYTYCENQTTAQKTQPTLQKS